MSREQLHQDISELLETLSINNNRLSLHEERLSQLDIDVLRRQCIDLYEVINKLAIEGKRPLNVSKVEIKEPVVQKVEEPEEVTPQAETPPIVEEPAIAPEPSAKVEPVVPKEEKKAEPVAEVKADPPKAAKADKKKNKADDEVRSIHSKLQDEAEMVSLFEKFNSNPIASISKAINISKRFEFQNNFFDGDAKSYKSFIEKLDGASDREDAFEIYHEYKNRLNWVHEELKDELKSLLYRKFTS